MPRRAALITLRLTICERFPPGRKRDSGLAWFECIQAEEACMDAPSTASHHAPVRVLPHIKQLDDCFDDFLIRVVCECRRLS